MYEDYKSGEDYDELITGGEADLYRKYLEDIFSKYIVIFKNTNHINDKKVDINEIEINMKKIIFDHLTSEDLKNSDEFANNVLLSVNYYITIKAKDMYKDIKNSDSLYEEYIKNEDDVIYNKYLDEFYTVFNY